MSILMKEIMVLVPFLPLLAALTLGVRGAYVGE
jgi:hypothetical protein